MRSSHIQSKRPFALWLATCFARRAIVPSSDENTTSATFAHTARRNLSLAPSASRLLAECEPALGYNFAGSYLADKWYFSRDSLSRHHATVHMGNAVQDSGDRQNNRRRVAQACKPCSLTKVRCDGERPCHRCSRYGHDCVYEPSAKRKQSTTSAAAGDNADNTKQPQLKRAKSADKVPDVHDQSTVVVALPSIEVKPTSTIEMHRNFDLTTFEFSTPHNTTTSADMMLLPSIIQPPVDSVSHPPDLSSGKSGVTTDLEGGNTTITTPSFSFGDTLDIDNWLNFDTDTGLLPAIMQTDPAFEAYSNVWFASVEPKSLPPLFAAPMQRSPIDQLYSRAQSPAMDKDSVGPREYHPTSIEVDAQLVFPDMEQLAMTEIDQENLAHVEEITADVVSKIAEYADQLERNGPFPRFLDMRIPPAPVLNSWIQLYFEHFHPVFPVLHKPSFSSSDTHWLLIFAVAALGAHFSGLNGSQLCARAMHELIRRQSSSMVSWI